MGELIVDRISAADRQPTDGDGLVGADGLAGERAGGTGGIERHAVAADHTHQGRASGVERGVGGRVIDPVAGVMPVTVRFAAEMLAVVVGWVSE